MRALRYLIILTLVLASPVTAQETGGTGEGTYGGSEGSYGGEATTSLGLSAANRVATPQQVVVRLNAIREFCSDSGAYLVDCMAERMEQLSVGMSGLSGYQDVRKTLGQTAGELRKIARDNRDPQAPRARVQHGDPRLKSSRPLVAVASDRKRQAAAAAISALEEAETILLRSAAQSTARAVQYQQIAAALGSNKVLLRSL
ncbi:hypothetical protein [Pseudophaeobacter sp. A-200-2]|uniref:hypothetical protein n=1 Tax=Pseudophaeobacter sp. A-200-2 TaxID=3098145 RepID=UPI0034D6AB66